MVEQDKDGMHAFMFPKLFSYYKVNCMLPSSEYLELAQRPEAED